MQKSEQQEIKVAANNICKDINTRFWSMWIVVHKAWGI